MRPDPKSTALLVKRLRSCKHLDADMLLCAHITAALVAPAGSFVSIGPVSGDIRVCVERDKITQRDVIWGDWDAWKYRWKFGPLESALGVLDRCLPTVDYTLSRRMLPHDKPPFECVLAMINGEVIGKAGHEDNAAAVLLSLLDTISPKKRDEATSRQDEALSRQPVMGTA